MLSPQQLKSMAKSKHRRTHKTVLKLPDLEQSKSAVRIGILLFLALTKPRGMLSRNATVKPLLVSLVEPVAYLKSELRLLSMNTT
jgi:hypothetical protein